VLLAAAGKFEPLLLAAGRFQVNKELTDRQQLIAEYIARGLSDKEIARAMGVTLSVIKNQVRTTYRKMGVNSRVGLSMKMTKRSR
jgi:DNA-binding NarL/FixJ family response regulator